MKTMKGMIDTMENVSRSCFFLCLVDRNVQVAICCICSIYDDICGV